MQRLQRKGFSLSFEANVDSINPTSFFIDDVSLDFCFQ